jgi:hypothetical protein
VALQLAEDRRDSEGCKASAAAGIEAVTSAEKTDRGDLKQFLEGLVRIGVPAGQTAGQRQKPLKQLVAGVRIALLPASRG